MTLIGATFIVATLPTTAWAQPSPNDRPAPFSTTRVTTSPTDASSSPEKRDAMPSSNPVDVGNDTTDVEVWGKNREGRTEVELVDTGKWDVGGALVPAVHLPIYLTDPFQGARAGGGSSTPTGYEVEWRLGWSFGRLSFEPVAGFGKVTGSPLPLKDGSTRESSLSKKFLGAQIRFTQPFTRISPFIAAGATYDLFSSPLLVRSTNRAASVDDTGTPTIHVRAGVFVRIATLAQVATAFFEAGASFGCTIPGRVFDDAQLVLSPFVALSLMGSVSPEKRPPTRPATDPARNANAEARDDAPRVEQECERGNRRSCESVLRFWHAQEKLAHTSIVPAVDALTQQTVGIMTPPTDPRASSTRLLAAWRVYERVSFDEAKQTGDQAEYEAFVARFPHGESAPKAQNALAALRFSDLARRERKTKSIREGLDYLEQHPDLQEPKDYIASATLATLPEEDLDRVAGLSPGLDARFPHLIQAAIDERERRLLDAVAAESNDAKAVEMLRAFATARPRSKRLAEVKDLEADRAYAMISGLSGNDTIAELAKFRERYASSPHVIDAARRERIVLLAAAQSAVTPDPMWRFLDRYPDDPAVPDVRDKLAEQLLSKRGEDPAEYEKFIDRFPQHAKREAMAQRLRPTKRSSR